MNNWILGEENIDETPNLWQLFLHFTIFPSLEHLYTDGDFPIPSPIMRSSVSESNGEYAKEKHFIGRVKASDDPVR